MLRAIKYIQEYFSKNLIIPDYSDLSIRAINLSTVRQNGPYWTR
jgi:hypothetical protein